MRQMKSAILIGVVFITAPTYPGINFFRTHTAYAEEGHEGHDHGTHDDPAPVHDEHEERDEHGGHEEHEEGVVHLNADKLSGLDLNTVKVRSGSLALTLELTGEVHWNAEGVAHVAPRVAGVVLEVHKRLGDHVREGDVLAVLDSRELAMAKAEYLTARALEMMSDTAFLRANKLWKQQVSAERDYLEAKNALAEAKISSRVAQLQLRALGLSEAAIRTIPEAPDDSLTRYEMTAPIPGVIVERHATRGEILGDDSEAFHIVDTSNVWMMGHAHERDLRHLSTGQEAVIRLEAFPGERFEGKVDYVSSLLDPETRTVEVRVVLNNAGHRFRAGMFGVVSVFSGTQTGAAGLLVPVESVQPANDGFAVFRRVEADIFRMVPVQVRARSKEFAQVLGDLRPGDEVVIGDTFVLKSEAAKEEMGGGHSH